MGIKNFANNFVNSGGITKFLTGKTVNYSTYDLLAKVGDVSVTGGTKFIINEYTYHVFSSGSDTFSVSGSFAGKTYDILVVGGGGAGGSAMGGGGAGGGLIYHPNADASVLSNQSISVVIGAGAPQSPAESTGNPGLNGNDTTFGTLYTALGGGGGSRYAVNPAPTFSWPNPTAVSNPGSPTPVYQGASGGSGGGGGYIPGPGGLARQTTYSPLPANSKTYGYGNAGGNATTYDQGNYYSRAGGGGAGGVGGGNANATQPTAGSTPGPGLSNWGWGGDGYQVPADFMPTGFPAPVISALGGIPTSSPEWRYFAGGGAAGSNSGPATAGLDLNGKNRGGLGNNTGPSSTYQYGFGSHTGNGGAGCPGRGGGGGGGIWSTGQGGAGGGGCIIIRYIA